MKHSILIALFLLMPAVLASQVAVPDAEPTERPAVAPSGDRVGEQAPPFIVAALDDGDRYLGNERFLDQVLLVDFWATWCPPCVEALPGLERTYEEFHGEGFEILSLSFDASDERVRRFREKRFAMPWEHGRLAGGFNDVVSLSFGLENIPHYVLIGKDGRIVAEGPDLHGDRLRRELVKILR